MPVPAPTPQLNRRQRRLLASGRARLYNQGGAGVAIPDTADGLRETLEDETKLTEIINGGKLGDFIKAYAEQHAAKNTDVKDQIRDEAERVMAEMLREHDLDPSQRPDLRGKLPSPYDDPTNAGLAAQGLFNRHALGAGLDDIVDSSGEFFQTIWKGNPSKDEQVAAKLEKLRNFSSDVPSDGGYLIPERLRSEMLRVALESAIVRPRARVIPMESLRVPFPAIDSSSNVNSVHGGIVGFWTEEGGTLNPSDPKFARVVLDAKKLTMFTKVPSELLADSLISLTGLIDQLFPEAMAFEEDDAFINGSGVGKPLGVLNGSAAIAITRDASNAISFDDVISMFARVLPVSMTRGVWLASPDTFPELSKLSFTPGSGTTVSPMAWLNNGQLINGPPMTLLGRPVIFTEKAPSLGSIGDLSFVDFGFYLVGDRQAMQARQSEERYFEVDEVAFRIIERVDGRPWIQSAITPRNNGSTLSPIVKLGST